MRTIPLSGSKAAGRVALVDDDDYELVAQYKWLFWLPADRFRRVPYARLASVRNGGPYLMHQMITGWPETDHRNHDGLDNRRHNLRQATRSQNLANQRPQVGRSSRFKGVCWDRFNRKWHAKVQVNYRQCNLGLFMSEEDAARAYDAAALAAWGEFACLNFPLSAR